MSANLLVSQRVSLIPLMRIMAKLISLNVGLARTTPATEPPFNREWTSGIWKDPVEGKHFLSIPKTKRTPALAGDQQQDPRYHGGPDNAINVYPIEHYERWRKHLHLAKLGFGAFGENITSEGLTEASVCVGDSFAVGDAILQITQPRQPCWKLAWKWKAKDFVKDLVQAGTTGWYMRVLKEGTIQTGDTITLLERLHPDWTIDRLNGAMLDRWLDTEIARELIEMQELSNSWRATFESRVR